MKRAHTRLAVTCLVALTSAACADLLGFKELHEADAGVLDAGGPDVLDLCPHAAWPGPPDANDPGTAAEYDLALAHVYFTTPEPDAGAADFGYDLDHTCTADFATASCQAQKLVTDDGNGRDNASIQLMTALKTFISTLDDPQVNATIANGQYSVVLRVFGLKSLTNQASTTGLQLGVQASVGLVGGGTASFDGGDRWIVATEDSISAQSNFPNPVNGAYVSGGVLVSTVSSQVSLHVLLPPGGAVSGTLLVTLRSPVLTARLVPVDGGGIRMEDGIIAGRWNTADMLASMADLTSGGAPLCDVLGGSPFAAAKASVCDLRDINSNGSDDRTQPCDGVSVAIRFDAVMAQIASAPQPFPTPSTPCPHEAGACP